MCRRNEDDFPEIDETLEGILTELFCHYQQKLDVEREIENGTRIDWRCLQYQIVCHFSVSLPGKSYKAVEVEINVGFFLTKCSGNVY